MKRNTLRWFGHTERMKSEEFAKKVYVSETVDPSSRGRPLGRWKDRVKEYTHAIEMSYQRGTRTMTGWHGESTESMY